MKLHGVPSSIILDRDPRDEGDPSHWTR